MCALPTQFNLDSAAVLANQSRFDADSTPFLARGLHRLNPSLMTDDATPDGVCYGNCVRLSGVAAGSVVATWRVALPDGASQADVGAFEALIRNTKLTDLLAGSPNAAAATSLTVSQDNSGGERAMRGAPAFRAEGAGRLGWHVAPSGWCGCLPAEPWQTGRRARREASAGTRGLQQWRVPCVCVAAGEGGDGNKNLAIGLGVGLGVGAAVLVAGLAVFVFLRRKAQAVAPATAPAADPMPPAGSA